MTKDHVRIFREQMTLIKKGDILCLKLLEFCIDSGIYEMDYWDIMVGHKRCPLIEVCSNYAKALDRGAIPIYEFQGQGELFDKLKS